MLFGAHVSVAGGYLNGLRYAQEIGAECFQFFAKSPRQWRGPRIDPVASAAFADACAAAGGIPTFTHTAYLLNLSTIDDELRYKTVAALADELVRAGLLEVNGVVTHVGNDPLADDATAARRAADVIHEAYALAGDVASKTRLLLENTAGGGSSFGCTFPQIGAIISETGFGPERLGTCLDTCHAFAYGMSLEDANGWDAVLDDLDAHVGLDRLGLIHANDCLFERGSRRDRHAWIGDGFIGEAGFSAMVCAPRLAGTSVVTEMPGDPPIKDLANLKRLKDLRSACAESH